MHHDDLEAKRFDFDKLNDEISLEVAPGYSYKQLTEIFSLNDLFLALAGFHRRRRNRIGSVRTGFSDLARCRPK